LKSHRNDLTKHRTGGGLPNTTAYIIETIIYAVRTLLTSDEDVRH